MKYQTIAVRQNKVWLSLTQYYPLIVGLIIVFGVTFIAAFFRAKNGMLDAHMIMNVFMGVFFIVFAVPKFFNLGGFAKSFQNYDILSKKYPPYAKIYPFIELTVGIILVSNATEHKMVGNIIINSLVAIMTGLTMLGVIKSLRNKEQLSCACMGTAFSFPLSKIAVIENGIMFTMAITMLFLFHLSHMSMLSSVYLGAH